MAAAKTLSPEQRSTLASMASHASWAKTDDRSARTEPARKASMGRFEREVDPEGKLPPEERAKRAENARRAYFQKLAYKSSRARQRRKVT